ncbi:MULTISPECIES: tol-pal system protein YbgF [Methylomonas]|uniref:tol-pal system protein YbgF n=1 Tax=Methylomonas TaxID=416 RepID=UPI0012320ADE|nr:tol-pal system protein YbgF [Methylomonas rhizoryzae]
MKKNALLMLCASIGVSADACAVQPNSDAYGNSVNYAAPAESASDSAVFELLGRLEQLQLEVQQLRGMVEEQAQTIADLERKQGNMYSDLDERLQLLSAQPASAQALAAQTPNPVVAAPPAAEASQPSPQAVAQAAAAQPAAVSEAPKSAPAPSASEQDRYKEAYDTLRNGHNGQAIQMLQALLADFPAGAYSDNAQYWLGEAYKIERDYDKSRLAFAKVVSNYPNSSKVPDALLKLGYIEIEQQNPAKARDYLTRVTTGYPGTTAAHLAAKKLAQLPQ